MSLGNNPTAQGALSSLMSMGGNLISGAIGGIFAKKENKRQRDYEREMYNRQYQDNLNLWNMQNQYNTPAQQMQRFKDAGLSPNLVYGQGTHGNAGNIQAPSPSIADQSKNYVNPAANLGNDMGGMINNIYDLRLKAEQNNLLREQVETQNSVQKLNAITGLLKQTEVQRNQTDNKFQRQTYNTRINMLQSSAEKLIADMENIRTSTKSQLITNDFTKAQTQAAIDNNIRAWQQHKISLTTAMQQLQNMKTNMQLQQSQIGLTQSQTKKVDLDSQMRQIDILLAKKGYTLSTGAKERIAIQALNSINDVDPKKTLDSIIKHLKQPANLEWDDSDDNYGN